MFDERFVRMRTHRNNIARYRRLSETNLTDVERQFIERRLSEEQSEFELLSVGPVNAKVQNGPWVKIKNGPSPSEAVRRGHPSQYKLGKI